MALGKLRRTSLALLLSIQACDAGQRAGKIEKSEAASPSLSRVTTQEDSEPPLLEPVVDLDGHNRAWATTLIKPGSVRVYSTRLFTWVYEKPNLDSKRLGYLRAGASSPARGPAVPASGCQSGFYPILPRGYVCLARGATLDEHNEIVAATREYPPDPSHKLPYIYGTVRNPGPVYQRLPSADELRQAEPDLDQRMSRWLTAGGEIGASYAQEVWKRGREVFDPQEAWKSHHSDKLDAFLSETKPLPNLSRSVRRDSNLVAERMEPRVGYSLLKTFLYQGRRYGITHDLKLVATDRLRPIRGSDFHGVRIGKDVHFPFALIRHPNAKFWVYQSATDRLIESGRAPYRSVVKLTGKQAFFHERLHYQTEDKRWLSDLHASRLDPAKHMPKWGKDGQKWIDVNLTKQTLMLYEGETPVYATLISSGEAGLEDPAHTTATKRGIFRIHTKHLTVTMSSDELGEEFELRDVPYVQYFDKEGYALHGAYWHDRFGMPKSHGCINLAPEDARRIFFWTEPRLPTGWHGVLSPLHGTVLFVHE